MPIPPPSLLDWGQIIQRIFDEPNGRIRTDAVLTVSGSGIQVIIDHTDDSIAIGTATELFTATTVGPKIGLDVNVINNVGSGGAVPYIVNLNMPNATTEYAYVVPDNTTLLIVKSRMGAWQFSFAPGGAYLSLGIKGVYTVENLNTSNVTIYFKSNSANEIMEINGWTL